MRQFRTFILCCYLKALFKASETLLKTSIYTVNSEFTDGYHTVHKGSLDLLIFFLSVFERIVKFLSMVCCLLTVIGYK